MSALDSSNVLNSVIHGMFPITPCGICENKNYEAVVKWPNHNGSIAHRACFKKIIFTVQTLLNKIQGYQLEIDERNKAHGKAIEAVRSACGSSIHSFFDQNGEVALRELFNTVGITAADQYANERKELAKKSKL